MTTMCMDKLAQLDQHLAGLGFGSICSFNNSHSYEVTMSQLLCIGNGYLLARCYTGTTWWIETITFHLIIYGGFLIDWLSGKLLQVLLTYIVAAWIYHIQYTIEYEFIFQWLATVSSRALFRGIHIARQMVLKYNTIQHGIYQPQHSD